MSQLSREDKEIILFLLSLEEDEFKMMLNSMTEFEALIILNNIQILREEMFDEMIERDGMTEAQEVINRIKSLK